MRPVRIDAQKPDILVPSGTGNLFNYLTSLMM